MAVEAASAAVTVEAVTEASAAEGVHRDESMMGWGTGAL